MDLTDTSVSLIAMGAFFGLAAGITPGPLLTLVITETLIHSRKEGIKVALAPLITDLPIILVTYFVLSGLSHITLVTGIISLLGGLYFTFLAYETMRVRGMDFSSDKLQPASLKKGITANMLNPNPYIFWLTAGIPAAIKASRAGIGVFILFFVLFYVMLTGSKIVVALLVERSKGFLTGRIYSIVMKILAISLLLFAVSFFVAGIKAIINYK